MKTSGYTQRLPKEVQLLWEQNLLSPEQLEHIEAFYEQQERLRKARLLRILLLLLGISVFFVLTFFFFYSHWYFSKVLLLVLFFISLLSGVITGCFVLLKGIGRSLLNEVSSVFTFIGALGVYLTFRTGYCAGDYHADYFLFMLLTAVVFVYLFRSALLFLIMSGGSVMLAIHSMPPLFLREGAHYYSITIALILLLLFPFVIKELKVASHGWHSLVIRYGVLPCFVSFIMFPFVNWFPVFSLYALGMLYGLYWNEKRFPLLRNPLLLYCYFLQTLFLVMGGNGRSFWFFRMVSIVDGPFSFAATFGFGLLFTVLFFCMFRLNIYFFVQLLFLLLPLLTLSGSIPLAVTACRVMLFVSGTVYIFNGMRHKDIYESAGGFFQLLMMILFFPFGFSFGWRLIGVIVLLFVLLMLSRYFRRKNAEPLA